jgi:chaperonin GroES
MEFKPVGCKNLILPDAKEGTTASGLFIPPNQQDTPKKGTVVKAGLGECAIETGVFMPNEIQDGDTVIYSWLNGVPIELDGVNYVLVDTAFVWLRTPKN